MEEDDRTSFILSETWPDFLAKLPDDLSGVAAARSDPAYVLSEGLPTLAETGLIEAQSLPQSEDTSADSCQPIRYVLHPAVAGPVRQLVNPALHVAADLTLASLHISLIQYFGEHETEGHSTSLVATTKRALPYLVHQKKWEMVAMLVEQIVTRDSSLKTLMLVLPLLQQATKMEMAEGGCSGIAIVLARTLRMADRYVEAEAQMRSLLKQADTHSDFRAASVVIGDLISLLQDTGRFKEALDLVERERDYDQRAGLGIWEQVGAETKRLQLLNSMGYWHEAIAGGQALLNRMKNISGINSEEPSAHVPPYVFRERLLDMLREAAVYTQNFEWALSLSEDLMKSCISRDAGTVLIANHYLNNYSPLLNLNRYEEARKVLQECRDVFENAGRDEELGKVYGACADLEHRLGNVLEASQFGQKALLHIYRAEKSDMCIIGHYNVAIYYVYLKQPSDAQAHRLASAIISLQINGGQQQSTVLSLAHSDVSGNPPLFGWVAEMVEQVPGVRFRELFVHLPKTAPDGDAAIAVVWEMARQEQARMAAQKAWAAKLPPTLRVLWDAKDMEALNVAVAQLPEAERQDIVRGYQEANSVSACASSE